MPKMIWYCHNCGTVLKLWKVRCPNCRHSAISWLHVLVIAVVGLPALLLLAKIL
jgi:ribosomal protein S27E